MKSGANDEGENIARKLDFNLSTFGERNKETVRLSGDLVSNENMFITHIFKTEYMKYDATHKFHTVEVDSEVLSLFSKITKVIRINNMFSVNSITDFYILQLLILENDLNISTSQRGKLKTEIEKLRSNQMNEKILADFEKELISIKEKLIEKTNEMLRMEIYHNDVIQKNNHHLKEVSESHNNVSDENQKIKALLNEIANAYKKGNETEFKILLNYVAENPNDFENKKDNSIDQIENEEYSKILKTEEEKGEDKFVQKVIGEFDKVLSEEFKRVERYFKRDSTLQKKKTLQNSPETKRRGSSGKNYVEWKGKSGHLKWSESLRTQPSKEEVKKVKLDDLAETSKLKIRNSISIRSLEGGLNSPTPNNKSHDESSFLKSSLENDNLSKYYENNLAKSHSHAKDLYSKKMHKKEVLANEKFENSLRKILFNYKHK